MNTDSQYIENEPIRTDKCRKRTVYGKVKRKHQPVRSCPVIQQTRHEYIKIHRQMTVHSHNHNSQPEEGLATTEDDWTPESRPQGTRAREAAGDGKWRERRREAAGEGGRRGHQGLRGWVWNWLGLSWKNGISRISENGISRSNTGIMKMIGI